jgi:hypothetical protein
VKRDGKAPRAWSHSVYFILIFFPLGVALNHTPAPPTPPVSTPPAQNNETITNETTTSTNATNQTNHEMTNGINHEATNGINNATSNGIHGITNGTINGTPNGITNGTHTAAPPTSAPTTPLVLDLTVELEQPTKNDVTETKPPPKKSHKKKDPSELLRNRKPKPVTTPPPKSSSIPQIKKFHVKFQNGHLTKGKAHTKTPKTTKLQLKGKVKPKTKTKLTAKTKLATIKAKTKPQKKKVGRPPKKKVEPAADLQEEPFEFVDGAEKVYYKTETTSPKKRPKAKLGNCVHCKKGVDMETVVICDAGCGTWFHASCSGYAFFLFLVIYLARMRVRGEGRRGGERGEGREGRGERESKFN